MRADARTWVVLLAAQELGKIYRWGGDTPDEGGFDCSGLVSSVFRLAAKHWPELYDGQRRTAHGLAQFWISKGLSETTRADYLSPGMVVFYRHGQGGRIFHVAIHVAVVGDTPVAIEAGGAGSNASTFRGALRASGSVRLSDTDYHGRGVDWFALDPCSLVDAAPDAA